MLLEELKKLHKNKNVTTETRFHKKTYFDEKVDYFVNISMPNLRTLAKEHYQTVSNSIMVQLITNEIHEYRLLALIILSYQIKEQELKEQEKTVEFYLEYLDNVNNWDLVDVSAANILGRYFYNIDDYNLLYELSLSKNLWYKRIAIVATYYMITKDRFDITLDITDNLLNDNHDLIHKACGWMLREVGKRNNEVLTEYLEVNYLDIPRTTLRYAIEKYPKTIRKMILKGDFSWR
ncbi:MAG: DNA alkylation repair protein [Candidatus Izemoplasmatales bacterium]